MQGRIETQDYCTIGKKKEEPYENIQAPVDANEHEGKVEKVAGTARCAYVPAQRGPAINVDFKRSIVRQARSFESVGKEA